MKIYKASQKLIFSFQVLGDIKAAGLRRKEDDPTHDTVRGVRLAGSGCDKFTTAGRARERV